MPVVWRHRIWGAEEIDPAFAIAVFFYGAKATLYLVVDRHDRDWSTYKKAHHSGGELMREPKLSDAEVREMIASGVFELGSHTLTHANLVAMLEQTGVWFCVACPANEVRTLAAIPLYHVYGMNCNINLTLYSAGTIVLVPQPTPDNILEAINRNEPTIWAAVPAMIHGMINHADIGKSKIGSLKLVA